MYNSIGEIKKEREDRTSALFKECGVFFAFSNKQFEENKTPVAEGEKYCALSGGGCMRSCERQKFRDAFDAMNKWYNAAVDEANLQDAEILYELHNHECYYTGDPGDVIEMFEGRYEKERILKVFYSNAS
jgi:hypothetical protein